MVVLKFILANKYFITIYQFSSTDNAIRKKYLYFARIQFLSYFLKQTSGEIPVVFDFKFFIYDKKKNIGHEHLFFSNHLKSTKIKQSSFGKHQKLNIHILTENCQNIPIYGNWNIVESGIKHHKPNTLPKRIKVVHK